MLEKKRKKVPEHPSGLLASNLGSVFDVPDDSTKAS